MKLWTIFIKLSFCFKKKQHILHFLPHTVCFEIHIPSPQCCINYANWFLSQSLSTNEVSGFMLSHGIVVICLTAESHFDLETENTHTECINTCSTEIYLQKSKWAQVHQDLCLQLWTITIVCHNQFCIENRNVSLKLIAIMDRWWIRFHPFSCVPYGTKMPLAVIYICFFYS